MQADIFPNEYDQQIDREIETEIALASKRSLERMQQLQNQKVKKMSIFMDDQVKCGLVAGIAFFRCLCIYGWANASDFSEGFDWEIVKNYYYIVLGYYIVLMCACIVLYIDNLIYKRNTIKNGEIDKSLEIEKDESDNELQDIRSEGERKKKTFRQEFEEKLQNMSAEFSNSYLVNNVSEWMTNAFFNMINAGDRRPYIQKVSVSFEFDVFPNQITCNLGVYDFNKGLKGAGFELKRCSNLSSPFEQAALARAIATAIKLNTVMHFPKDPCGSDILIEIDYKYTKDSVHTMICYTADNLAYEERTSWYEQAE